MTHSKHVVAMLNSQAEGDAEMFYSVALQAAAAEARRGHQLVAEKIRTAVKRAQDAGQGRHEEPLRIDAPRGELTGILALRQPRFRLNDVVLADTTREQLNRVAREQLQRASLRSHGVVPSRRLLFAGLPGSGKTMTAEAISAKLKIPLYVIRLESLITRYLGETAAKLRLVFDVSCQRRGVYLFDEFDSLGGSRTAGNDVGEMRRVLNSFLQFMEEPNSTDSVIVAATNHPQLLDVALRRRFDLVLKFDLPTAEQIREVVELNTLAVPVANPEWARVTTAAEGLSQAEIVSAVMDAVKVAILDDLDHLHSDDVVARLQERRSMNDTFDDTRMGASG